MARIIFLNRFFYPDHSATSQILTDLAFALTTRGFEVHVITSRQRYDDARAALPACERVGGVHIHRVVSSRFGRGNLFGRALDYLTYYFFAAWRVWRLARKGDVVVAKTDPPLISVVVAPITRLRGARLVNWLQDLFPEVAQEAGVGGRAGKLLFSLLRRLRNRTLVLAQANIVLGDKMAERLRGEGIEEAQIRVIANWQDGRLVKPMSHSQNPLRAAWGLEGKFVVAYSGNLGRVHELTTLLGAMEFLQSGQGKEAKQDAKDPKIVFLFIGGGALHEMLTQQIAQRGLTNVEIKPYQPREQLSQSLSLADLHLVTLRPEFEGLIVPSKFYGVAAAGRATLFIGERDGEIPRLLREHRCGLSVQPGDCEELARHIEELSRDGKRCRAMGRRARAVFEQRFDKEIAVEAWCELFGELKVRTRYGQHKGSRRASGA
jgi:colanic acid biosynthesis glycosyl transferase WcaI